MCASSWFGERVCDALNPGGHLCIFIIKFLSIMSLFFFHFVNSNCEHCS